jgi:chromosome segregation ATPase
MAKRKPLKTPKAIRAFKKRVSDLEQRRKMPRWGATKAQGARNHEVRTLKNRIAELEEQHATTIKAWGEATKDVVSAQREAERLNAEIKETRASWRGSYEEITRQNDALQAENAKIKTEANEVVLRLHAEITALKRQADVRPVGEKFMRDRVIALEKGIDGMLARHTNQIDRHRAVIDLLLQRGAVADPRERTWVRADDHVTIKTSFSGDAVAADLPVENTEKP